MEKKKLAITAVVTTSLTVSTVFSSLPTAVYAQENTNVIENKVREKKNNLLKDSTFTTNNALSGECGATENDKVNWELIQNNSDNNNPTYTLKISGKGAMKNYTQVKNNSQNNTIEKNGMELNIMGSDAPWYSFHENITKIEIGTDITRIGNNAFIGSSITELPWSEKEGNYTNLESVGECAFAFCSQLKKVSFISSINEYEYGLFQGNTALKEIDWTNYNPDPVDLSNKLGIKAVSLPRAMFEFCTNLTGELYLPENIEAVNMESFRATGYSVIDFPTNMPNVRIINAQAFAGTNIEKLVLPDATKHPDTILGNATFFKSEINCDIVIPHYPNTKDIKNNSDIVIGGNTAHQLFDSAKLHNVIVEDGIESLASKTFSEVRGDDFNVVLPNSVKIFGEEVFGHSSIKKFNIQDDVTLEKNAFLNCTNLNSIRIGNNVKNKENAFSGCTNWAASIVEPHVTQVNNGMFSGMLNNGGVIYTENADLINENNYHKGYTSIAVLNGGTFDEDTEFELSKLSNPTKQGYVFNGWYENENFTGEAVTKPEADKTYYAKWTEKTTPTISFKDDLDFLNREYNGSPISLSKDNCTVTPDDADVKFSYQIKDGENWKDIDSAPQNAGTYQVKAIVEENDTYKGAESDWKEFTISKATPTEDSYKDKIPTNLTATTGQTLADVKLPEGFTWKDSSTSVGEVGTHEFDAIFTPTDTLNYNSVNVKINVKVEQRYVPSIPSKPTEKPDEKPSIGVEVDVVDKIAGETRYDTSVSISQKVFPSKSEKVYLVSGEKFPDALSSAALAGKGDGPILLINDKNIDKILAEIDRLDAKEIVFVGGNSISTANEAKIRKFAKENSSVVNAFVGEDRYETAIKVAEQTIAKYGNKGKVIIADGRNYPDAVSIAPYAAKEGIPVILVNGNKVPSKVKVFLNKYKINNAIIVGGYEAVGKDVEKLFKTVDRVAGDDRYDTSKKIAEKFFANSDTVFMASGESFADSLSVSYYAGIEKAPVLLTKANSLDDSTREYLNANKYKDYVIIGGDKAVNPDLFK